MHEIWLSLQMLTVRRLSDMYFGLNLALTSNDLNGISLTLSSTCVHFPRAACGTMKLPAQLLEMFTLYLSHLLWRTASLTPEAVIMSGKTVKLQRTFFTHRNLSAENLQCRCNGKSSNPIHAHKSKKTEEENQVRAAHIHKRGSQDATGHASAKSTMSFGHPVRDGYVYATVVSERDEHSGLDWGCLHGLSGWCMTPDGAVSPGSNQSRRLPV